MSVKIKTEDTFKYGQKNVIPFLGVVQISEDGTVEVESKEIADKIVECNIGFKIVEEGKVETTTTIPPATTTTTTTAIPEEIAPKTEEEELGGTSEDNNDIGGTTNSAEDLKAQFTLLKVADLQAMANPFPKSEWQNLKKDDLVTYLVGKLGDSQE